MQVSIVESCLDGKADDNQAHSKELNESVQSKRFEGKKVKDVYPLRGTIHVAHFVELDGMPAVLLTIQ